MTMKEKQRVISVSDVYHLWNHLLQRYYVVYITEMFEAFARDEDFRLVLKLGQKTLSKHISLLENKMAEYGIPLPMRPSKQTNNTENLEIVSDRHIFRRVLRGIQAFLPIHNMAFTHSTSPAIRNLFMAFLDEEMKLYDKYMEYGRAKGYVLEPPVYKI